MTVSARVSELAEQIRGVSYGKEDASTTPRLGYLPVLRAGNISDDGLIFDDLVFVPAVRIADKQKIRCNDVVIAASSGSLDVVGKAARALDDYEGGFGAFCKVLRPNPDVNPSYFAHFFRTQEYRQKVSALAAGLNINNLRNEHLDNLTIPLPPPPEQRRIAEILDKADALCANHRAALAQLDILAKSTFFDMFGDPIKNPRRYPVQKIVDLVDPLRPITYGILKPGPNQDDGIKYVRVVDMREGGIDLRAIRKTSLTISEAYRRSLLLPGDLLMSIRGHVGRLAIVPNELDRANITQDTARLALKGTHPVFVRECLRTPGFQQWMAKHTKGVAVRGINLGDVKLMPIIQPPIEQQRLFVRLSTQWESVRQERFKSLMKCETLFRSLQYLAFRGEL